MQGKIYVSVQYKPISQDPLWNSGVLGSSRGKEDDVPDGAVPHVYFPMRKGCRVTMYNDAHQVLMPPNPSAASLDCDDLQSALSCPACKAPKHTDHCHLLSLHKHCLDQGVGECTLAMPPLA